jgi:myosin heavy subunit
MDSTSTARNTPSNNAPTLTPNTSKENQAQRRFPLKWLLMPLMATPFFIGASSYSNILYAYQSPTPVRPQVNEPVATTAPSSLELELALKENDTLQQKYRSALEQLQGTQNLHTELQVAYQDAQDTLHSLKRQNQQLQALAAERSPLVEQTKQLESQIHSQKQQLTALANHLDALENQKRKLTEDNQQLQSAAKELNTLKPELEKARQTIVLLSNQLNQKSDPMATFTINGKQFSVSPELAAALNGT